MYLVNFGMGTELKKLAERVKDAAIEEFHAMKTANAQKGSSSPTINISLITEQFGVIENYVTI